MATVIRTSKNVGRRLGFLLTGALSASVFVFLIATDFVEGLLTGFIALLPAIFSLVMVAAAFRSDETGSCPCPYCGTLLTCPDLTSNAPVLCGTCHRYLEAQDRVFREIERGRVASRPLFRSPLPANAQFPDVCCVCASQVRRRDETMLTSLERQSWYDASGPAGETSEWKATSVRVPYCDSHRDGAILGTDSQFGPYVRFCSYPYLRAFCELNHTQPE